MSGQSGLLLLALVCVIGHVSAVCTLPALQIGQAASTCTTDPVPTSTNCSFACTTNFTTIGNLVLACDAANTLTGPTGHCEIQCQRPTGTTLGAGACPTMIDSQNSCNASCAPGHFLSAGTLLASCNNSTLTFTGVCTPCGVNMYEVNGICNPCPSNSTSLMGSVDCTCNRGFQGNYTGCAYCPANQWGSAPGVCSACATGETNTADHLGCVCPAGFDVAAACSACIGRYANNQPNGSCYDCGIGFSQPNGTNCDCFAGYGFLAGAVPRCQPCNNDGLGNDLFGTGNVGDMPCQNCTSIANTIPHPVSGPWNTCRCMGGYYWNTSTTSCPACMQIPGCDLESCFGPDSSTCSNCGPGWVTSGSVCNQCQAGSYEYNNFCYSCGTGTSSPAGSGDPNNCTCPMGKYLSASPIGLGQPITCTVCPFPAFCVAPLCDSSASYQPINLLCQTCDNTHINQAGVCVACGPGLFANQINNTCDPVTYEWIVGRWGDCDGRCGEGLGLQQGNQTRDVLCLAHPIEQTVEVGCPAPVPISFQACTAKCPTIPTIVAVKGLREGLLVNFTADASFIVGNCENNTCNRGVCDTTASPAVCRVMIEGVAAITTTGEYGYGITNGSTSGAVIIPKLMDGKSYTFALRSLSVPVTAPNSMMLMQLRSEPSPMRSGTPDANGGCALTCVHGLCVDGTCRCDPGYSGLYCDGVVTLNVSVSRTSYEMAGMIMASTYSTVSGGYLLLLDGKCKTLTTCVPIDVYMPDFGYDSHSVSPIGTSTGLMLKAGQQYFFRLMFTKKNNLTAESELFTVTDPLCTSTTCMHAGICLAGMCMCTPQYTGSQCEIPMDACLLQTGYDCDHAGLGSTCVNGVCKCMANYTGSRCEKPPGCNLDCKNNGWPVYVSSAVGCLQCTCSAPWTGKDCSQCTIVCAHGGKPTGCTTPTQNVNTDQSKVYANADGSYSCDCPEFWDGEYCTVHYYYATLSLNIGSNNINDDNRRVFMQFVEMVLLNELDESYPSSSMRVAKIDVSGGTAMAQIRFYGQGAESIRMRLINLLANPDSYVYTTNPILANADPNVPKTDPLIADDSSDDLWKVLVGAIVGGFFGLVILCLCGFFIYKRCSGGSSGTSSGSVPMETRS